MKTLLSLPPNTARTLASIDSRYSGTDWFCASDPTDRKVGSGGGTVWLLDQYVKQRGPLANGEKAIIVHGGGQSRRLPAYATVGKVLAPVPVLRWAVGEAIDQDLLSMQLPLYQRLMELAPANVNTLIASGDVCLRCDGPLAPLPEADVICFGLWVDPVLASRHGVFMSHRDTPDRLDFMLQKPSVEQLAELSASHYYMMDIGLWLLSDKAIERLKAKSTDANGEIGYYDLYSTFGCALGLNPSKPDADLADLRVAILPLPEGEFYHFGTTRELLSSTLALQNKVADQRLILQNKTKPNPALFVQNCHVGHPLTSANENIWIENSYIAPSWTLTRNNVVTGVPQNDWTLTLSPSQCVDVVPIGGDGWAVRPYGFDDTMRGPVDTPDTLFLGQPITQWAAERGITLPAGVDIQSAPLFPVTSSIEEMGILLRWMLSEPQLTEGKRLWLEAERLSADQISAEANLERLYAQRREHLKKNIPAMASNYERSVYYQLDLADLGEKIRSMHIEPPRPLGEEAPLMTRIRNHMLRAVTIPADTADESRAFELMQQGLVSTLDNSRTLPRLDVYSDQIVWGRSPVRIDLAGGWTDTPPYSLLRGGNVVNAAIELNNQPPLQVFIKPCPERHIVLRSIDLGATEVITSYEALTDYQRIGSPFSLPKAALALAGFAPQFCPEQYGSLTRQLDAFGSGIEITLLSAVPAGSGLGTSSILAATILSSISDFCGLAWDNNEVCARTLALEQLLTTCGGWQDQYGGVLEGVKLLQTAQGWNQTPRVSWLPTGLFNDPEYASCHLLYYTGITRTAKEILGQIVRNMFLNRGETLRTLDTMRTHALDVADAIQRCQFDRYGRLIATTWEQNQLLDSGTNPQAVQAIINRVSDLLLGCKLPGAGGGGFLYMVAKDPEAAGRVRRLLTADNVNPCARFVEMNISRTGTRVSRS